MAYTVEKLQQYLEKDKKNAEKVFKSLMGDIRKRAPGWIATEVANVYGVKKAEVSNGVLGTVKVKGNNAKDAAIIFAGRMLTPTHFGMTPKAPGANSYTLKASILKGQKKTLGKVKKLTKKQRAQLTKNLTRSGTRSSPKSPIMLMYTGNKKEDGVNYIPFQRVSKNRKEVHKITAISLPQMVSSKRTKPSISSTLDENIGKRLDHYMSRYMGK